MMEANAYAHELATVMSGEGEGEEVSGEDDESLGEADGNSSVELKCARCNIDSKAPCPIAQRVAKSKKATGSNKSSHDGDVPLVT